MKSSYHLYIETGCSFCDKHKLEYVINIMDCNEELLLETKKKYSWETVPMILEISETKGFHFIGGYAELCTHFGENND